MAFSHLGLGRSMRLCLGTVVGMIVLGGWQSQGCRAETALEVASLPSATVTIVKPARHTQWLRLRPNAQEGFKQTFGDRPISNENQKAEAALPR